MKINNVAIIGMGALGLMYGEHIKNACGQDAVHFVMDHDRYLRHKDDTYVVNGVKQNFVMQESDSAKPADLVIVATKYTSLDSALDVMKTSVGENTVIISVLNGISSENIIAEHYPKKNIVHCVAIGMDAMRDKNTLTYCHKGHLAIGAVSEEQKEALDALDEYFDRIKMPYTVEEDILHTMWGKFMLNVGVNQTCMVYDATYGEVLSDEKIKANLFAAMREVLEISKAEKVNLTEEDFEYYSGLVSQVVPDGFPSMRQDSLAKRKSEVDLFSGTVISIAKKHNIPVPVNEFYYKRIKEIESTY